MTLYTYNPYQYPYQISTFYTLQTLTYSPEKILNLKVTTALSKVKSRSHHDVGYLHSLTNVPTKYQLPTLFPKNTTIKILKVRVTTARSNQGHTMTLHSYSPYQCPYQVLTLYTLLLLRLRPDKISELEVTAARLKVKSRSYHDIAHLHPLTNIPIKYQLPTYNF